MGKEELLQELGNWLTTKQLLAYVQEKYGRHWTRQNIFQLQTDYYIRGGKRYSKKPYQFETIKIAYTCLYLKESVDMVLKSLKRKSSKGGLI